MSEFNDFGYVEKAFANIREIVKKQGGNIHKAASMMADAICNDKLINVYAGGGHTTLAMGEMFFRAGGLANINPIMETALSVFNQALKYLELERTVNFGASIVKYYDLQKDDLLIIFHNIGINPATIDAAMEAKKRGVKIIAVASSYWQMEMPADHFIRHPTRKNLFDFEDVCFGPRNLGLDKKTVELRAYEALQKVKFPEELYFQPPFDLSGGQKRRVAIAGVLAMKPQVLIRDEPTAGLDPAGRDEILDMIADMHKELGITIILVSHSMEDVAKYVDRIIVMNSGQVMLDGEPKAVFRHYRELEEVDLAAPQVTYLMHDLAERGLPVNLEATTIEEARDSILEALREPKKD